MKWDTTWTITYIVYVVCCSGFKLSEETARGVSKDGSEGGGVDFWKPHRINKKSNVDENVGLSNRHITMRETVHGELPPRSWFSYRRPRPRPLRPIPHPQLPMFAPENKLQRSETWSLESRRMRSFKVLDKMVPSASTGKPVQTDFKRCEWSPSSPLAMCGMYFKWGENMKQQLDWLPTENQKKWLQSLGMKPAVSNNRGKRQVQSERALRKEYRSLSSEERSRFHRAVNQLKATKMDGRSKYDILVSYHQAHMAPGAHFGPAFLGFHREFLLRFETALRDIDPQVSVPYWDSNLDYTLGDDLAAASVMWTEDFMGNGVGEVVTGPFANWPVLGGGGGRLWRNLTAGSSIPDSTPASLTTDDFIVNMFSKKRFRELTWFVDMSFERGHGSTHNWVGGIMADLPISPSDPVFFLHHAFIDCLWEQFRDLQRSRPLPIDPRYDFPNDSQALGVGMIQPNGLYLPSPELSYHYSQANMEPFRPLRNIDGLRDDYFDRYYTCEPSPVCSSDTPTCHSDNLFCDLKTYRCAPKLQLGVQCDSFAQSSPCHQGVCCDGFCRATCASGRRSDTGSGSIAHERIIEDPPKPSRNDTIAAAADKALEKGQTLKDNNNTVEKSNVNETPSDLDIHSRPPIARLVPEFNGIQSSKRNSEPVPDFSPSFINSNARGFSRFDRNDFRLRPPPFH